MPAVLTERVGHILIVTLNRPDRMNAINGEVLVRFYDAMVEADTNPAPQFQQQPAAPAPTGRTGRVHRQSARPAAGARVAAPVPGGRW